MCVTTVVLCLSKQYFVKSIEVGQGILTLDECGLEVTGVLHRHHEPAIVAKQVLKLGRIAPFSDHQLNYSCAVSLQAVSWEV